MLGLLALLFRHWSVNDCRRHKLFPASASYDVKGCI